MAQRHVFKWYRAGTFNTIVLGFAEEGHPMVTWNNVRVGGWWSYAYDMEKDEGRFEINFNCKGQVEKEKVHMFVQVKGTAVYELERERGRGGDPMWDVLLITCSVEDGQFSVEDGHDSRSG